MSSTLEDIRQTLDDIETLKHLSSYALQSLPTPPHHRVSHLPLSTPLSAAQLTRNLVQQISAKSQQLVTTLPSDSVAQARIKSDLDSANTLSAFYAKLRELRDVHRTNTRHAPSVEERERALLDAAYSPVNFSGEEGRGRYLDLMQLYAEFMNIVKRHPKVEYYEYVDVVVTDFEAVGAATRSSVKYREYLTKLMEYLIGFAKRAHPLHRIDHHVETARQKEIERVKEHLKDLVKNMPNADALLAGLGAEGVKKELLGLGLKCGGRPIDRATRLLNAARSETIGDRCVLEGTLKFILNELLIEERVATVANVRKKLSQTYAELEAERLAEESLATATPAKETEEPESTIYNPKDVPLGWDGKPIPYWMYKLHGLNHEFKCEICGGATYRGPRAFERHFTEATHVAGLRCLGIGYSRAFMMITGIRDAVMLKEKLEATDYGRKFDQDVEMEFEDAEGNVLNRKTYEDLRRQGLI